jgi:hypothetical protein
MYISSLLLMAMYEDRVRGVDRSALTAALRSRQPGRVRGRRIRSWAPRDCTALRARSAAAGSADAGVAGARP